METCWPSEQLAEYLSRILTNIAVVFARTFAWWHHPCEILCWYGTQFHEKFIYRTPADEAIVFANMFVWWCHAHNNYTDMALHFVKKLFHGELSTFWGSYPHEKLYWHGAVIYVKIYPVEIYWCHPCKLLLLLSSLRFSVLWRTPSSRWVHHARFRTCQFLAKL